jgi:hypothetical protein
MLYRVSGIPLGAAARVRLDAVVMVARHCALGGPDRVASCGPLPI